MISIVIPAYNEGQDLSSLLTKLKIVLRQIGQDYEIMVVDAGSTDATQETAAELGAKVLLKKRAGYGAALKEAFEQARGDYIITLDADFSHDPVFIRTMWEKRDTADLLIASRYVAGGKSDASLGRRILSVILNRFFSFALSLPLKDLSSGFRMYKKEVVRNVKCERDDHSFLAEMIIKIYGNGYRVTEVPFHYLARKKGKSHIKLFRFGISYCATLLKMWQLRNSIFFADYDARAFNSRIPVQRYWQRQRFKIIMDFVQDKSSLLDIGCGTSRIIGELTDAVGLDIELFKLRYLSRQMHKKLCQADIKRLPFKNAAFKTVICSEVIEHVEKTPENLREMYRVLKDGGELVVGTPDYGRVSWLVIEWLYKKILPNAYGKGHISRYSYNELVSALESGGFLILNCRYILGSEMIIRARKIADYVF